MFTSVGHLFTHKLNAFLVKRYPVAQWLY